MFKKEAGAFGVFTIVCYVPASLGRVIEELRESLPGEVYAQAHITLVPPRPLEVPIEAACDFAAATLQRFSSFEVVLGDIQCFPETNLLYFDLAKGEEEVQVLHDALNRDVLEHQERFEFRPHITLGGPVEESEINVFRQQVRDTWLGRNGLGRFEVMEIVGLWWDPGNARPDWTKVLTRRLGPGQRGAS